MIMEIEEDVRYTSSQIGKKSRIPASSKPWPLWSDTGSSRVHRRSGV